MGMIDEPRMIRLWLWWLLLLLMMMVVVNGSSGSGSSEGIASSSAWIIASASHDTAGSRDKADGGRRGVAITFGRTLHRGRTVGYVF